ncbi:MAG: RNA 2',3'-cyclic phosphodiesterase, partial [Candidatus Paceibacterota bacterium]
MAEKRIFTAINLPKEVKKELIFYQEKWSDFPVRWTPPENLHITLVFIGDVNEKQLKQIKGASKKVGDACSSFSIKLYNITLGPPNRPPRMFWVEGKRNEQLVDLHHKLEDSLVRVENTGVEEKESRTYHPHITLGRINQDEWKQMSQQPTINEEISMKVPVNSFEVME